MIRSCALCAHSHVQLSSSRNLYAMTLRTLTKENYYLLLFSDDSLGVVSEREVGHHHNVGAECSYTFKKKVTHVE